MKHCILVGASPICDQIIPDEEDFIIAVDGGWNHLKRQGINPHLLIGDMDSIQDEERGDVPYIQHPAEKDDTDMALAIAYLVKEGYAQVTIYGGLGGRIDHSMGNFALFSSLIKEGIKGKIIHEGTEIFGLSQGEITIWPKGEFFSVLPYTDIAKGVTIQGGKYPLKEATLSNLVPLGVSNAFVGEEPVSISVTEGILLVILPK